MLRAVFTSRVLAALLAAALAALLMGGGVQEGETARLERRAEEVLSGISKAGKVEVVIATCSVSKQGNTLLSSDEAYKCVPCGAVAVAEGAGDPLVNAQLTQALSALLGLPLSAVSVISGGSGR